MTLAPSPEAALPAQRRLDGRITVVSGGAGGIGRAASLLFAAEGATVAIVDRQGEAGRLAAQEIRAAGGQAEFFEADLTRADNVVCAVSRVIEAFGPITVLFNHAGTVTVKPFLDCSDADWESLIQANLMSMVRMTRAVLPGMLEAGGGAIVNTCSVSSVLASSLESIYCVTKAATLQFTRAITAEFRGRGVRCNAICPAAVRTDHGLREREQLIALGEDWSDEVINAGQVRVCEPDEVASVALFLASDEASFLNGTAIFVDNGLTATA